MKSKNKRDAEMKRIKLERNKIILAIIKVLGGNTDIKFK